MESWAKRTLQHAMRKAGLTGLLNTVQGCSCGVDRIAPHASCYDAFWKDGHCLPAVWREDETEIPDEAPEMRIILGERRTDKEDE